MSYVLDGRAPASKVIYIDTRDVVKSGGRFMSTDIDGNPITSYFKFLLKTHLEVDNAHEMLMSLHSCSIPYSFYNIRDGVNDFLDFEISHDTIVDASGSLVR